MTINFLMCSERSGSNFITKLLNGHGEICGPSPKHIINPLARNLFRYGDLKNENNWNELLADIHRLLTIDFSIWKAKFSLEDLKDIAITGDVKGLVENIFLKEAKLNSKQHLFIKENHLYEFFTFLLINFPDSKYIYLVRDPRDMALSWKKSSVHRGGVVRAAHQWKNDQQNSLKNYDELKKLGKAYLLTYEDLISNSVGYVKDILSFLSLDYDENITTYYKDELTRSNAEMQETWSNLSKGVLVDNKNKYLGELSKLEIMAIEKICYYEMLYFGYVPMHSKSELDSINNELLDGINKSEMSDIQYNRTEAVVKNMDAKKVFYEKLLK